MKPVEWSGPGMVPPKLWKSQAVHDEEIREAFRKIGENRDRALRQFFKEAHQRTSSTGPK